MVSCKLSEQNSGQCFSFPAPIQTVAPDTFRIEWSYFSTPCSKYLGHTKAPVKPEFWKLPAVATLARAFLFTVPHSVPAGCPLCHSALRGPEPRCCPRRFRDSSSTGAGVRSALHTRCQCCCSHATHTVAAFQGPLTGSACSQLGVVLEGRLRDRASHLLGGRKTRRNAGWESGVCGQPGSPF